MRIDVKVGPANNSVYLDAQQILRYLIQDDKEITDLLLFSKKNLHTTDKELYEALSCIKKYDEFKLNKVTKLLERTDVTSHRFRTRQQKKVVTFEKIEELRKQALSR